jgi:hypothetical protein
LHQEIGFAIALGKPMLPVTLGSAPVGIISGIQALELRKDLADAPAKLSADCFSRLMNGVKDRPATYESDDNVRRALLLARYSDSVSALDRYGQVRQMASLTTFHLPDRSSAEHIWKEYFPDTPKIEDFDNRMRDLLAGRKWKASSSRAKAVAYLQAYLKQKSNAHA